MDLPAPLPKAAKRSAPRETPTHRPYHHGNLRTTLLDAADALLAERGEKGVTLRDVARLAGVSHAAPYHHFASLSQLLAAVAERGFVVLGGVMSQAVSVPDTRERLLRVSQAYVDCARAHPERFRLMFGPMLSNKDEHPGLMDAAHRAFGFVLSAANAHDRQHGATLALAGWSLAHGLSHLIIDGALEGLPMKQQDPDTLARKLCERIVGGK
jgi:AcrR family transcriptional regulator